MFVYLVMGASSAKTTVSPKNRMRQTSQIIALIEDISIVGCYLRLMRLTNGGSLYTAV